MTFSDLYVKLTTAPGVGTSRTFVSRKNLSTDNISLAIADTATVGSDTTNKTTLAAGDLFDISTSVSGTPADAITNNQWSAYATSANQVLWAAQGSAVAATNYIGIQSATANSTTLTDVEQAFPTGGKIRKLYAYLGNNTITSGSYVVTLYKNGSPTALTCTLDSSNRLASDTSNEITVAEGDLLAWQQQHNTPSTNRTILIACEFAPDTPGEGVLLATSGNTAVAHGTKAYSGFYNAVNVYSTTIGLRQHYALPVTFKKIYALLGTAPGVGNTRTLALDNNGSDALAVTISGTSTSGSTTGSAAVSLGDPITLSSVRSASAATSTLKVGLVFQAPSANQSNGFFRML